MAEHDQCLVITFVESTHVLAMNANDELDEAAIEGFVTDKMTLFCGSLDHDHTVQVRHACMHAATTPCSCGMHALLPWRCLAAHAMCRAPHSHTHMNTISQCR
jgi:hypothetical protein